MVKLFLAHTKEGFTLVELLVAATIIGILAVFATNSYRNSVAETRWTQAKANADRLGAAMQRVTMDYDDVVFSSSEMSNVAPDTSCPLRHGDVRPLSGFHPSVLISCGYLENGDWNSEYYTYHTCGASLSNACKAHNGEMPLACVSVRADARLPAKFKSYTYCYYVRQGGVETLS